ncbi:hypothetical protein INR49_012085, partial [Caranx melampygus]
MWTNYRVLVFALAAASSFTPVYVQDFCQSSTDPDCHSHEGTPSDEQSSQQSVRSRWNTSSSDLIQDLDKFRVSCKKLMEAFPIDEVDGNFVRNVKNCIFSKSVPTPLRGPLRLAAVSKDVIEGILDLDMAVTQSEDFLFYASGGRLLLGSVPLAHRYGGHQFGYWAGQLGDGRAHSLGQYYNRKGEIWELQLKGSGKTPYSRSGDGRAVIRSSVREFLCSEAMHFLGVPTSRAASLIVSEEPVVRDQFYNGNVKKERGAVVLRLAKSWFRIGSLEILAQSGEIDLLRKLLNFVIDEHFPSISSSDPHKYLMFFSTVVNETAHLVAQWMSVGFSHGVCNTDNFSLLSITIDYGPFGFMESYNPNFVPNTSDDEGRYSIGAQANVGLFNLEKLLEALSAMMEDTQSDFTMTFRQLSEVSELQLRNQNFTQMWALEDLSLHKHFSDWLSMYLHRVSSDGVVLLGGAGGIFFTDPVGRTSGLGAAAAGGGGGGGGGGAPDPAVVVEGSLAETLRSHPWVEVGVVEGGCPLQVEVEGSWSEDAAAVGKVLPNSWQSQEVVEEGTLGLEVVAGESQLMVGVEVE